MNPGDVLTGRFELLEPVATGGMSVLWRARDRQRDRTVAVKVVENASQHDIERFGREARTLVQLEHPHIVSHIAHGSIGVGAVFLAMELLEGEALDARLTRGTLSVADTLILGLRVAEALAVSHQRGVIHRDVKPSNLFLRDGQPGRVVLVDFGVARLTTLGSITPTGQPMGTPMYMAPEQAKSGRGHVPQGDVYSLGAVMFECLAGRPPFAAPSIVALLSKVLLEPPPKLRSLRPDAPVELERLIARMLSKRPDERHDDGAAAAEAIHGLLLSEPARLSSRPPPSRSLLPAADGVASMVVVLLSDPGREGPVSSRGSRELRSWRALATELAREHDGFAEVLSEGTPVIVLRGGSDPTEVALRGVEVARRLAEGLRDVVLGVATVTGDDTGTRSLVGGAIDIASSMLLQAASEAGDVLLDPFTSELIEDAGGRVLADGDWFVLER